MRTKLDVAYTCFFLIGMSIIATGIGLIFDDSFGQSGTGYILYWIGAPAWFVGLGFSVALWRFGRMRLLALLSLLFLGAGMLEGFVPTAIPDAVSGLYGLTASVLSVRWFMVERRRFH